MGRIAFRTVLGVLLCAACCQAEEEFNVDLRVGWDNCHRPGQWAPLEIGISTTRKEPFNGSLVLSAQQDTVTKMEIRQPMVITKDLPLRLPMATKLSFGATECRLRLVEAKGRTAWSGDFTLSDYRPGGVQLVAVRDEDVLIGTSGRRSPGLAQLPQHAHATRSGRPGILYVRDKLPALLPWDWAGYACLDMLVLSGLDWTQLNTHQVNAIVDYVTGGGKLILVAGSSPWPTDGPLTKILPIRPGKPYQAQISDRELNARPGQKHDVSLWPLTDAQPAGWKVYDLDATPIFACGRAGFGQVGLLAFNPADLERMDNEIEARLWVRCLSVMMTDRVVELGSSRSETGYQHSYSPPDSESTNQVLAHLLTIPQLRPLNIWYVIGLLALLAVMLGPVDYLLLRWLDRLPWTWVTSACTIAAFTVAAYYGVKYYRAGDLQIRAVSVVDSMPGQCVWSTTYAGIFAPDSDDYTLDGLVPGQWWSAISPARDEYAYMRESQLAGRTIYCQQHDGSNLPVSLPISIYSMQCLISESQPAQAPLTAEVISEGGKTALRVTNNLAGPIQRLSLVRDGRVSRVGQLGPKVVGPKATATLEISGQTENAIVFDGKRNSALGLLSPPVQSATQAQGISARTAALERYTRDGSWVLLAEYDQPPLTHTVQGGKGRVDHRLLARMVIPPPGRKAPATQPAVERN